MRTRSMLSAVLLPAVLLVAVSCNRPKSVGGRAGGPVTITASCSGDNVSVTVSPWQVSVGVGKPLEFDLAQSADVSAFTIRPDMSKGKWPYPVDPSGHYSSKDRRVNLPMMAGGVKPGDTGHYAVELTCTHDGVAHNVVIDPDVIIE